MISVASDAVELDDPIVVSRSRFDLPGADIVGFFVPSYNSFRARSSGRRANLHDLLHDLIICRKVQFIPLRQNI